MDKVVRSSITMVLASVAVLPAAFASEANSSSYHQFVEVVEDEGRIEVFATSDPDSSDVEATFDGRTESLGPFQFGFRLDGTRRRRHVRPGEPVDDRDAPDRLGSIFAAIAVRDGMSAEVLQDRLARHLESELRTASPQALFRRWRGLRSIGLFVDERVTDGIETEYDVLLCSREAETTTARVVRARDGTTGLGMEMELLQAAQAEPLCDDLGSSFSPDSAWTFVFREPVSIVGRELRMTFADRTSGVVASLPDGAAFGPALERAGENLVREGKPETVWVQPPGGPVTPPARIDPESDLDASRYLGRFELTETSVSYGVASNREELAMGDILTAWMFTRASSESAGETIEAELRRRLQEETRPLTVASVEEILSSIAIDGSFTIVCANTNDGARTASYVVEGSAGPILSAESTCEALDEEVPRPEAFPR